MITEPSFFWFCDEALSRLISLLLLKALKKHLIKPTTMYELVITHKEILPLIDERIATLAKGAGVIYSSPKEDSSVFTFRPFTGTGLSTREDVCMVRQIQMKVFTTKSADYFQ